MLLAVLVVAGAWTVLQLIPVLLVIAVSLFIVGTLNPAVEWLEERGIRRRFGIALVFSGMLLTSVLAGALTIPALVDQLTTLAKQEPAIRDHVAATLARWRVSAPLAESLHSIRYDAMAKTVASAALLAGGTMMGILGALLALPVAAAIRMLIEELRLELPGEWTDDAQTRARDDRAEKEYERRAEGVPAEQAAAIAVEISEGQRAEEAPSVHRPIL